MNEDGCGKMGKNNMEKKIAEEVEDMALPQNINQGFIVANGKESDFFKKINDNRPTEEFWAECEKLRHNINQKAIDEMNALMDRDE